MKKYVWEISARKSAIYFKVKYYQVSNITGYFLKFKGQVLAKQFFIDPEVSILIQANTAETYNTERNKKLKSKMFLDADEYPYVQFTSLGGCIRSSGRIWEINGELSVKGVKSNITLVINYSDVKEDVKRPVIHVHLFGKVNMKDLGLEGSSSKIGNEVNLYAEIYLVRKP